MKFRLVENSFRRNSKWNDNIDYSVSLPKSKPSQSVPPKDNNSLTDDLVVKDITLLSAEEAKQLPEEVRNFNDFWWWLKSPGYLSYYAAYVNYDGLVNYYGDIVSSKNKDVRPALIIPNLKSSNLVINNNFNLYDEVEFKGIKWIMISDTMLLCNETGHFGYYRFDKESNDYETSEIKEYIHKKAKEFGIL